MATGQHGNKGRYKNEVVTVGPHTRPENIEDRGNLTGSSDLAEDARDRFHRKSAPVEKIKTSGYNKVLQDDKRREPYGNDAFDAQHNESGDKHCLIGDGIEVGAQICFFAHDAGDESVKKVCDSLEHKKV